MTPGKATAIFLQIDSGKYSDDEIMWLKMEYNKGRPYKHGGKII